MFLWLIWIVPQLLLCSQRSSALPNTRSAITRFSSWVKSMSPITSKISAVKTSIHQPELQSLIYFHSVQQSPNAENVQGLLESGRVMIQLLLASPDAFRPYLSTAIYDAFLKTDKSLPGLKMLLEHKYVVQWKGSPPSNSYLMDMEAFSKLCATAFGFNEHFTYLRRYNPRVYDHFLYGATSRMSHHSGLMLSKFIKSNLQFLLDDSSKSASNIINYWIKWMAFNGHHKVILDLLSEPRISSRLQPGTLGGILYSATVNGFNDIVIKIVENPETLTNIGVGSYESSLFQSLFKVNPTIFDTLMSQFDTLFSRSFSDVLMSNIFDSLSWIPNLARVSNLVYRPAFRGSLTFYTIGDTLRSAIKQENLWAVRSLLTEFSNQYRSIAYYFEKISRHFSGEEFLLAVEPMFVNQNAHYRFLQTHQITQLINVCLAQNDWHILDIVLFSGHVKAKALTLNIGHVLEKLIVLDDVSRISRILETAYLTNSVLNSNHYKIMLHKSLQTNRLNLAAMMLQNYAFLNGITPSAFRAEFIYSIQMKQEMLIPLFEKQFHNRMDLSTLEKAIRIARKTEQTELARTLDRHRMNFLLDSLRNKKTINT